MRRRSATASTLPPPSPAEEAAQLTAIWIAYRLDEAACAECGARFVLTVRESPNTYRLHCLECRWTTPWFVVDPTPRPLTPYDALLTAVSRG